MMERQTMGDTKYYFTLSGETKTDRRRKAAIEEGVLRGIIRKYKIAGGVNPMILFDLESLLPPERSCYTCKYGYRYPMMTPLNPGHKHKMTTFCVWVHKQKGNLPRWTEKLSKWFERWKYDDAGGVAIEDEKLLDHCDAWDI